VTKEIDLPDILIKFLSQNTLPYDFEYYFELNNSFQGGVFDKVRQLIMDYRTPIKSKLFQILSHDFPFLEFLSILNGYPIEEKQPSSTLIIILFLTFLDLQYAHIDYVSISLDKNTHLLRLLNLSVKYKSLTKITNNFTIDAIHFNFGTIQSLDVYQSFVRRKNFHDYFSLL
jgi:hypothetical protein